MHEMELSMLIKTLRLWIDEPDLDACAEFASRSRFIKLYDRSFGCFTARQLFAVLRAGRSVWKMLNGKTRFAHFSVLFGFSPSDC
jgi:hypothetical protein